MTMTADWHMLMQESAQYADIKYELRIGPRRHWLSMAEAGRIIDDGLVPAVLTGDAMMPNGTVRLVSNNERRLIHAIADEWSANK